MVIGESARPGDLDVNPLKGKQLTNMRTSGADDAIKLVTPRAITLESAMEWIEDDELIEITPISVRIRKKSLDPEVRKRQARDKKTLNRYFISLYLTERFFVNLSALSHIQI